MEKLKLGIIGLGGISQVVHLPIFSKLKNVSIQAVAEVNKNRLLAVGEKFNIAKRFTDYNELLKEANIDAVIIATPTSTHHEISIAALKAGKHIFVEKPIARNFQEAKAINDLAEKNKLLAFVGMNLRFRPDAMLIKSLINSGELGNIFYIRCNWYRKQSSSEKWFMRKDQSGGGVLIDLGVALLDLATWFLDFPDLDSVTVKTFNLNTKGVEDSAVGFIKFKNQSVISFEVSWSLDSDEDSLRLRAFGKNGTAHLNPIRVYKRLQGEIVDYSPTSSVNTKNMYKKSYENELKHFIGAIIGNNPVQSSSKDALRRMQMLEAIYKSAEENREIKL
ncbi:MAG: Gfo/Idh/MocA family oxidoreductase [Melioribacteraceae bacterium]|nr:Gfo/Idh/MocA family oxidoreductase [Melioribacteraceae bacterium]